MNIFNNRRRLKLTGTLEYALNAVNQGVTSLGIKGTTKAALFPDPLLTCARSNEWHCPRDRKEVLFTPDRSSLALQSFAHHPQHRYGLQRYGT